MNACGNLEHRSKKIDKFREYFFLRTTLTAQTTVHLGVKFAHILRYLLTPGKGSISNIVVARVNDFICQSIKLSPRRDESKVNP